MNFLALRQGDGVRKVPSDPGVRKSPVCVVTLNLADPAKLTDHVFCKLRDVGGIKPLHGLNFGHFLLQREAIVAQHPSCQVEGVVSNEHVVKGNACAVNVDLLAVGLARDLLRRHEQNCADFFFKSQSNPYSLLRSKAEINNL